MLLQLNIENFRSIRDEVELSMQASDEIPRGEADGPVLWKLGDDLEVLRCAALYGANASGKSNLVKALLAARRLIVHGTARPDARRPGLPPFRLDAEHRARPSSIELYVLVNGQVYGYGFAATDQAIEEESLTTIVDGREQPLFSRSHGKFDLSDALTQEVGDPQFLEFVARGTPRDRLFLHEATRRNVDSPTLFAVFAWFQQQLTIIPQKSDPQRLIALADTDPSFCEFLERVMGWADTGINGVSIDRLHVDADLAKRVIYDLFSRTTQAVSNPAAFVGTDDGSTELLSLRFHHGEDSTSPIFELEDESDGTRRLLDLAPVLYQASKGHTVLVIDELDRSLHSLLARELIETFIERLPPTTQLIFTAHDTNLLESRGLSPDCVWFTEKNAAGATTLYSLAEFKPEQLAVLSKDLEKGYLRGRFGGVPFLSEPRKLAWMPRKDEEG